MDIALSTRWHSNIHTEMIPLNFFVEIRALTPGGKRTQFTYLPMQTLIDRALGIDQEALAIQIEAAVTEKVADLVDSGELGTTLASENW